MTEKCVPQNYSCDGCWCVNWAPCPGNTIGGALFFNSYEKALEAAQKTPSNWVNGKCYAWDDKNYKIYIQDDPQVCATNPQNAAAIADLKSKIMPFLKRYKAEIANYKKYFNEQTYKPGAIYDEYKKLLDQSDKNAEKLSGDLNSVNDQNLADIQAEFDNVQNQETQLTQKQNDFVSYVQNNSTDNANASNNNASNNNASSSNSSNNNTSGQKNASNIYNNIRQMNEANKQVLNTLQDGLNEITNTIIQNNQKKLEEEQERIDEQNRQRQEALRQQQEEKQQNAEIYNTLGAGFKSAALKKPSSNNDNSLTEIYYTGWYRAYNSQTVYIIAPFKLRKYSDDTWPMLTDFEKKIQLSLASNGEAPNAEPTLYGYYSSDASATDAFNSLKSNAANSGLNIKIITVAAANQKPENNSTNNNDFWDK